MFKTIAVAIMLGGTFSLFAQLAPPLAPEQIVYRHWPEQFIQWLGPELPYSTIELYVDSGSTPSALYDAVLTDRATGKRIHYSNQQPMVDTYKSSGAEAYLAKMQLDRPANPGSGATYLLRFVDHAGQPVSWQFIQGSDMSERGGGSSPAGVDPPVLVYRQQGAVAGEGTALKIGNAVSVADLWTEISHPPYFVAYHGAMSQNVAVAVFTGNKQQWTIISSPKTLSAGATWKLTSADGIQRTFEVQAVSGDHATILDRDGHYPGTTVTIEATLSKDGWSFDKLHYAASTEDANQGLTISFVPGVSRMATASKFDVVAGRKTRVASGMVHADTEQARVGWNFKDPQWLRDRTAWVASPETRTTIASAETVSK